MHSAMGLLCQIRKYRETCINCERSRILEKLRVLCIFYKIEIHESPSTYDGINGAVVHGPLQTYDIPRNVNFSREYLLK